LIWNTNLQGRGWRLRCLLNSSTRSFIQSYISNTNTQCFFDNGNVNNQPIQIIPENSNIGNRNFVEYRTETFLLRPKQTGLITILPAVTPQIILAQNPDLEIRGFIELVQARRAFGRVPEADVLITPETRGTFLDNDYPSPSVSIELDFDQLSYSLPTASGQAQNVVERPSLFVVSPRLDVVGDIRVLRETLTNDNPGITEEEIDSVVEMIEGAQSGDNQIMDLLNKIKSPKK